MTNEQHEAFEAKYKAQRKAAFEAERNEAAGRQLADEETAKRELGVDNVAEFSMRDLDEFTPPNPYGEVMKKR